jgi:hypothetical protein
MCVGTRQTVLFDQIPRCRGSRTVRSPASPAQAAHLAHTLISQLQISADKGQISVLEETGLHICIMPSVRPRDLTPDT